MKSVIPFVIVFLSTVLTFPIAVIRQTRPIVTNAGALHLLFRRSIKSKDTFKYKEDWSDFAESSVKSISDHKDSHVQSGIAEKRSGKRKKRLCNNWPSLSNDGDGERQDSW